MDAALCSPAIGPIHSLLPCDSVETFKNLVACSTYKLKEDGSKTGAIELYRLLEGGELELRAVSDCDAVFGSRWLHGSRTFLVSVTSSAGIVVHALSEESCSLECELTHRFEANPDMSCLSVDVLQSGVDCPTTSLAVSRSDGRISVCTFSEGPARASSIEVVAEWDAHSYGRLAPAEVWCAAWRQRASGSGAPAACDFGTVLWSGGDDALLKGWDIRCVES